VKALPVDALREEVSRAVVRAPLVLCAPTGSGKSTQVPRWLEGQVVVVEPRRVACRSLAARIAELEGEPLGQTVGYRVRGERRQSAQTRILFVTPGIALRDLSVLERADAVVLDEFHERRLDVDLLFALLASRKKGLVVMSATMDGPAVAAHLEGELLESEGRLHPVEKHCIGSERPHGKGLPSRVAAALERASTDPGDVLVFLPGRSEIAACAAALRGRSGLTICELHGGLSLEQQSRAFAPTRDRKVVLATNVAETSVTLPGVGVVIDSGLVRRTRYHRGRAYLGLTAIASDSAEQRAGRAGRTGPGVCYRLWGQTAILEARTPPEVYRESLVPLVLGAANAGHRVESLPLFDPPKDYALEAAREELTALGALNPEGLLTELGRELFQQPLDAPHARLLIEAQGTPSLGDAIDLVSVLALGRRLFVGPRPDLPEDDLRDAGCDAVAFIRALRMGEARAHGLTPFVLREARRMSKRLRRANGLDVADPSAKIDREGLAKLALRADPRTAHVARRRKRAVAFANGGTELELGRESAVRPDAVEAIVVLDSRAIGTERRDTVIVTCAMPIPLRWLRELGLGRERIESVRIKRGIIIAKIERVHAKKVIDEREEVPTGELAREAMLKLVLQGRFLKEAKREAADRLMARGLAAQLSRAGVTVSGVALPQLDAPTLEEHLRARISDLGVESGEDAKLLSADDLLPEDLEPWVRDVLDAEYPRTFEVGDASYRVEYNLDRRQIIMHMTKGTRTTPPPASYLPRFAGFRVTVESRRGMHVVR